MAIKIIDKTIIQVFSVKNFPSELSQKSHNKPIYTNGTMKEPESYESIFFLNQFSVTISEITPKKHICSLR